MKDKNSAFFLLEAIGEISEETLADAENVHKRRLSPAAISAVAAALVIVTALALILGLGKGGQSSPVSMQAAIESASEALSEQGISATLSSASLISDAEQPYYLIKLSSGRDVYDCLVDAHSGEILNIELDPVRATEPTETPVASATASKPTVAPTVPATVKPTSAPAQAPTSAPKAQTVTPTFAPLNIEPKQPSWVTPTSAPTQAVRAPEPTSPPPAPTTLSCLNSRINASSDTSGSVVYFSEYPGYYFAYDYEEARRYDVAALLTSQEEAREWFGYLSIDLEDEYLPTEYLEVLSDDYFDKFGLVAVVRTVNPDGNAKVTSIRKNGSSLIPKVEVREGTESPYGEYVNVVRMYQVDRYFLSGVESLY